MTPHLSVDTVVLAFALAAVCFFGVWVIHKFRELKEESDQLRSLVYELWDTLPIDLSKKIELVERFKYGLEDAGSQNSTAAKKGEL